MAYYGCESVTDNYVCESCVRGVPCCSREHTLDHHGLMQDETYGKEFCFMAGKGEYHRSLFMLS